MSTNLPILSIALKPTKTTATTIVAKKISFNTQISGRVRLASESDVPHFHKLMHQMAKYHNLTNVFNATETSISTNLFKSNNHCPPFYSVTSLILEISPNPLFAPITNNENSNFDPILKTINLDYDSTILDSDSDLFRTINEDDVFVAGYVLLYPSYSGFFEKPDFFIENIYVRECYRRHGFGKMLFSAVASQAVNMGFSRIEWLAVGWNVNAIEFYLGMGAYVTHDLKRFRLSTEKLDAFAKK